ncbi:MAG: radical SAM protein [Isosphaeraceae bacterium]
MQSGTLPYAPRQDGLYKINEVFYSIQGEGRNTGTPMAFIRFSDCNLSCTWSNSGFDCDTEFVSGRALSADEALDEVDRLLPLNAREGGLVPWLLLTGGEPALQVDESFIAAARSRRFRLAIESNGTIPLRDGFDYIAISPKSAEHTIRQKTAHEVRYVRHFGMGIPVPTVQADWKYLSPSFQSDGTVRREDLDWCVKLVLENPGWMLSLQAHKLLNVR